MTPLSKPLALVGAVAGLAAGIVAERAAVKHRHRADPEAHEPFGARRGERSHHIQRPDGARLFLEEAGPRSKRGIVFLHGSGLRTDLWHYQMAAFEGRRLVFLDLRGHGLSRPKGDSDFTLSTLSTDLLAVIADLGLEQVVLVGHSLGGMVALQLCRLRPEVMGGPVMGLVLTNTTHRPAIETVSGGAAVARLERAARRPLDLLGKRHETIDQMRRIIRPSDAIFWAVSFSGFGPGASAHQVDFAYDMLAETSSDVIFDLFKCYRDFDVAQRLAAINVPVLVIAGASDRITVPEASRYLAKHLPNAEMEVFEGCGHMAMLERHREFNTMVESFARKHLGRADRRRRPRLAPPTKEHL